MFFFYFYHAHHMGSNVDSLVLRLSFSFVYMQAPGQPCDRTLQEAHAVAMGNQWKKALLDR